MRTYTSVDGITIKVGEDAKENDILTQSSFPNEWWMHVDGGAGSHVVICCEDNVLPRETKRDAATLAVYYSKSAKTRMARVNVVRVDQVLKHEKIKNHGQVYLEGPIDQLTILPNKEGERLTRLLK